MNTCIDKENENQNTDVLAQYDAGITLEQALAVCGRKEPPQYDEVLGAYRRVGYLGGTKVA